jgi:hypothetical protein
MQSGFSDLEYAAKKKQTRRGRFLAEIEAVTPWAALVAEIEPFYRKGEGRGRPPIGVGRMLRMIRGSAVFRALRLKGSRTRSTKDRRCRPPHWARSLRSSSAQGQHPRQGRASVPRGEEPDQAQEDALTRLGQERGAVVLAVRPAETGKKQLLAALCPGERNAAGWTEIILF